MQLLATLRTAWRSWWSPYFRQSEGQPLWALALVTMLFSAAIGLALTAFSWVFSAGRLDLWQLLWRNLVISESIGFSIFGLFALAARVFGPARIDSLPGLQRALFFSLVPLAGVVLGYGIGFTLLGWGAGRGGFQWVSGWFVSGALMIWAVLTLVWWRFYRRELQLAEVEKQLAADRARAAELERQAVDARLRALQAQIEPHFLFNTLANVVSLVDAHPTDAKRMLERLIELLRASLSASRARHATLGQEFDLCRAYLEILSIRMGGRLRYDIAAAAGLRELPLPPMLLQPLIENAIQHGLEPKVEGGCIRLVAARNATGMLEIAIEDNGVGFSTLTRGGGVGLSNLRERLAVQYGSRARLAIEDAGPGTRVRLILPPELEESAVSDAATMEAHT
jgi:signal transduction histidine kinase